LTGTEGAAKFRTMKTLFLALTFLSALNAFATTDLNRLAERVCAKIPEQIQNVTPEQCLHEVRVSVEGIPAHGNWWGKVTFADPHAAATYSCEFDVHPDDSLRVFQCEHWISRGE
jgi:hypothetical protein